MDIVPQFAMEWHEDAGYVETGELIGFKALDARGEVLAYGETETEAFENAMEAQWGQDSERGMPPSAAVVAR